MSQAVGIEQKRPDRAIRLIALGVAAGLLVLLVWNLIDLFSDDWLAALVVIVGLSVWELIDFWRARRRGLPYP